MPLIKTTSELEKALHGLAKAPFITIDTEFHRETTYYPELCLIQAASPSGEILIDPLAKQLDLTSFFALMQRPDIIKVFHAARQDIEIIFHLSGQIPAPLFDTQIAAMACGYGESVAYHTLVQKITGIALDKSSRITDWAKRPLTQKQLDYALADVTHLRDVYLALSEALRQSGRQAWLKEEMAVLQAAETYQTPPELAWRKVKGAKGKLRKPQQRAALQCLAAWRESRAQSRNLPRGYILSDDSLTEIAAQLPRDKTALLSMRGLRRPPRAGLDAEAVLQAVADGLSAAARQPQQFAAEPFPAEQNKTKEEMLKLLLKIIAESHNVAQKMIAGGDDMAILAAKGEKADIAALRGWRFDIFGKKALALLAGELAIKIDGGKLRLFAPGE